MNRIFRLIWNPRLAMYVPAPESGRGRGKGSGCRRALGAVVLSTLPLAAYALPMGGQVSAGQGSIGQSASAMTVTQQSPKLAINWQSFGIGAAESVNFAQPSASAIALNRVLGADASQIYGRLSANGQVWLLNPNGVLIGGGAQVNVGGLVASTLNLSDADFLGGKRSFSGSGGSVVNQGALSAADGGYVALLGGKVSNEGVIQARLGTVALGAGNQVTLDFAGDKLLNLQVDQGAVNALVENKQLIRADGGAVLLSARAANALLDTVVNNAGIIEARTVDSHNGTIKLLGGMEGGTVQVGGTLDASAPSGGDGGLIETSGARVSTAAEARITTAAAQGRTGQWLIDPTNFTIAREGGDMTGAALGSQLGTTNVTILSSSGSAQGSGDVKVNDSIAWNSANALTLSAYHDVRLVKTISNSGTGNVTLRADNTGACVSGAKNCGTVSFTPQAGISVNGGAVNLYYNPAGSNHAANANGNGPSYASPTDYSGYVTLNGDSTLNAWMLVNDVNQLQAMNTNLAGTYALGRDIDAAATAAWNGGAGFVPVGSFPSSFTGNVDGLLHTISGLTINRPSSTDVGLFRQNDGHIANLGLLGGAFSGALDVGGLVGFNAGSVGNSYSTGSVNGGESVGGLIGFNAGTVLNSYSSGTVNGSRYVGGLIGSSAAIPGLSSATVSGSHSSGPITGSLDVGGLVGVNFAIVANSYSTGTVNGNTAVGGLVGENTRTSGPGTVSNSYSTGAVNGGDSVGGLVGANNSGGVSNSYSTGTVNGTLRFGAQNVGGLVGKNAVVVGFGISTVNNSYSTGAVNGWDNVGGLVGFNGGGTVSNSYSTGYVGGRGNSVGGLVGTNSGTVAGSHSTGNVSGGFSHNAAAGGLIGSNDGGTVNDSYSTGGVSGYTDVGGLIGYDLNGAVTDSYSTGAVYGVNIAGGLIGYNDGGAVNNSHSTGAVTGAQYGGFGGLIGANGGNVSNSYSTGSVAAYGHDGQVGGLIGSNGGTVSNSYSTGAVTSWGYGGVGGLIGSNGGAVSNSYSTGAVAGVGGYSTTGGLVGTNAGSITNSYWDTTTSGQSTSAGGTGLTDAQMKQKASFTGFDFINIWDINQGASYPFLRAE